MNGTYGDGAMGQNVIERKFRLETGITIEPKYGEGDTTYVAELLFTITRFDIHMDRHEKLPAHYARIRFSIALPAALSFLGTTPRPTVGDVFLLVYPKFSAARGHVREVLDAVETEDTITIRRVLLFRTTRDVEEIMQVIAMSILTRFDPAVSMAQGV